MSYPVRVGLDTVPFVFGHRDSVRFIGQQVREKKFPMCWQLFNARRKRRKCVAQVDDQNGHNNGDTAHRRMYQLRGHHL